MRTVRIIREAVLDLLASGVSALLLLISVRQVLRRPGIDNAMLGGPVPVTVHKWPWLIVIAAVLLLLWLGSRAIGGRRGPLWGAWAWLVRMGFWWSVMAMLLFVGVAVYGLMTRAISDLNWPFTLGYLGLMFPILLVCWFGWRRTARLGRERG